MYLHINIIFFGKKCGQMQKNTEWVAEAMILKQKKREKCVDCMHDAMG